MVALEEGTRQVPVRRLVRAAVLVEQDELHGPSQRPGLFEEAPELDRRTRREGQDANRPFAFHADSRADRLPGHRFTRDHGASQECSSGRPNAGIARIALLLPAPG